MSRSRKKVGVMKDRARAGSKRAMKQISARSARHAGKGSTDVYRQPSRARREAWRAVDPYDVCDFKSFYEPGDEKHCPRYKWFMK